MTVLVRRFLVFCFCRNGKTPSLNQRSNIALTQHSKFAMLMLNNIPVTQLVHRASTIEIIQNDKVNIPLLRRYGDKTFKKNGIKML